MFQWDGGADGQRQRGLGGDAPPDTAPPSSRYQWAPFTGLLLAPHGR
eukprot:CAMPEP_0174316582 /NCGR_PEP_ID=MMETSP0810-20121108/7033_1 /TAXON_ID=73025 ORGANISM="Eutreptiella gymnastica-like, Strain CCMP1594" /NCGR_SAMPLE_ID=MMETSP0810 /ASSEMBLY_ACC=CAM_ASM_000659 /LENGTH=46 /DNA_ID= /DNA_START= /DNA_END= /DNA_ORIENTATION=